MKHIHVKLIEAKNAKEVKEKEPTALMVKRLSKGIYLAFWFILDKKKSKELGKKFGYIDI